MKSIFFLPVYNQADELPNLIAELQNGPLACDNLLFVNNGSTDSSGELILKSGFAYLDLPVNLGVGYSFMQALDWALKKDFDLFGSLAGNGKMCPGEMGRVLTPLKEERADYVTGSRYLEGGAAPNLPRFRNWAIPLVSFYASLLTGQRITDATCGYRAFRLDILRRARFNWHAQWLWGYSFESYLYAKVLYSDAFRCLEVPISMRYPERGKPYTKMKAFISWYEMIVPWLVARLDRCGFE